MRRMRVWHGIGSAVLAGAVGAGLADPTVAWAQTHTGHAAMAQAGGEGGEGGEAGAAAATDEGMPADPDQALTANLLLMRGHLRVGDELVRAGRWSEALPHFLHPIEEVYGLVRAPLAARNAPPFGDALDVLARSVQTGGDQAAYATRLAAAQAGIDQALATVPEPTRQSPSFVVGVAVALLDTAAEEYGNAFVEGRLGNVVEYQDSLGFVAEAKALLDAHGEALRQADADRYGSIMGQLGELATTWPAVEPPAQPVRSASEVLALVSGIELDASGLR